jgi:pimeloyl-ACP methyl ester carboxylesterase
MSVPLAALAVVLTVVAMSLPARRQTFTFVEVGGRTMRLLIAGEGPATVVFENGLGPPLEMWGKVQPAVSRFARTVTYDRPGAGLSDDAPPPRDGSRIASELRRALRSVDVRGPYVLVGASLGGPYVRIFAGMYPSDVAGLVLVDPTPDSERAGRAGIPERAALPLTLAQARASLVPAGTPVVLIDAVGPMRVPFATHGIRTLLARRRPDIEAESREHREWVARVPGARVIVTDESGHNVAQEQPELVVEVIRQILLAER